MCPFHLPALVVQKREKAHEQKGKIAQKRERERKIKEKKNKNTRKRKHETIKMTGTHM